MLEGLGRTLVWIGVALFVVGLVLVLLGKIPGLGRLPGDLVFRRGNLTVLIPLGTMILLSVLLTLAINIIGRLRR